MQDEQFMRSWNDSHDRFSAEVDRGLSLVIDRLSRSRRRRKAIRNPYGIPVETESSLPPRARASLRGLAATLFTVVLWAAVLMVATPTPGFAASHDASPVACACTVLLPLA
jgi:hypothetical protein